MVPLSILDLCPVADDATPADALRNSAELARAAETWGYRRYWVAEHHNMVGIASAATAVVLGHIGAATSTMRIGAGGIMLPNHAPLVIAEQFGTLAALFGPRIDLGLGRAPGTDPATARALRRDLGESVDTFPDDVRELQAYFGPAGDRRILAVPGTDAAIPIWILGSSLYGAQLAAAFGLPYAFAAHFAPDALLQALAIYRARFRPSAELAAPHVMVAINACVADDDASARRAFTSHQQAFLRLRRGMPGRIPAPVDDIDAICTPAERALLDHVLVHALVGSKARVADGLAAFVEQTRADEIMVTGLAHDHRVRMRSFELVAELTR